MDPSHGGADRIRPAALTPLAVADYPMLRGYFRAMPFRLSVYSLASLIAWRDCVFQAGYTIREDGTLVLAYESGIRPADRHMLIPLSPGRIVPPVELHRIAEAAEFENAWFVPQDYLEMHDKDEIRRLFDVSEQPGYEDYVYRTEDLASLKGNRYMRKRNLVKQFCRDYGAAGRVAIKEIEPGDVPDCLEFLEDWCRKRDCGVERDENLACEKRAAIESLKNLGPLEMKGLSIRVDGRVRAFAVASRLTGDMGVLNFEKADPGIRGLYQVLEMESARRLFAGCRYINKESDLGLENLARAKHSYHPVLRVKSYRFRVR